MWPLDLLQANLKAVEHFITVIGQLEDTIFQKRAKMNLRNKTRVAAERANSKRGHQQMAAQGGPANQNRAGGTWTANAPSRDYISGLQPTPGQAEPGESGLSASHCFGSGTRLA